VATVHNVETKGWIVDETILDGVRNVDAILVRVGKVTKDVIDASKKLRVIAVFGAGVDRVDVHAATDRKIIVTNSGDANSISVAEFTFGLILSISRKIPMVFKSMKNGGWRNIRQTLPSITGFELYQKTLGVVGFGNIGRKVTMTANTFGMTTLVYDPYVSTEVVEKYGAKKVDFKTLLRTSDIVTLHVPLTTETLDMIGRRELKMMKRTANLINTSRGQIVDEEALYEALKERWIAGAAIDVMKEEPPRIDNPLLTLNNIIITPHIAVYTKETLFRMTVITARDIVNVLRGQRPLFPVNPEVLDLLHNKEK
jgi:D-3-phosphoglycerate dehydrogenase